MQGADGVDQIGQAFERKILALHRDEHALCAAQAVEREHGERRRAVDEDVVVLVGNLCQCVAQAVFAPIKVNQLNLGARQIAVRREQ